MKQILSVLFAVVLAAGMVSCKGGQNTPEPEDDATKVTVNRIQVQYLGSFIAYMLFYDEQDKVFVFPVNLSDGAKDVELGTTYVYPGDMNPTYAYWMLSDYTTHALYEEASFTKTEKSADKLLIKARVIDKNGDKWALTYEED